MLDSSTIIRDDQIHYTVNDKFEMNSESDVMCKTNTSEKHDRIYDNEELYKIKKSNEELYSEIERLNSELNDEKCIHRYKMILITLRFLIVVLLSILPLFEYTDTNIFVFCVTFLILLVLIYIYKNNIKCIC